MPRRVSYLLAMLAVGLLSAAPGKGQGVLSTSKASLGVFPLGNLGGNGTGVLLNGVGDALFQGGGVSGCLCEGWGASFNDPNDLVDPTRSGFVRGLDGTTFVIANLSPVSFSANAQSITSVANVLADLSPRLEVTHLYKKTASPYLFEGEITIRNLVADPLDNISYRRIVDWDAEPTPFSEFVTIQRQNSSALIGSSDGAFANPDPLTGLAPVSLASVNTDFVDLGPLDQGTEFVFDFGTLNAGASLTFSIFFGAAPSEQAALNALGLVGAETYGLAQSSGIDANGDPSWISGMPGTWIIAFKGVGGDVLPPPQAIPEPGVTGLLAGLVGFGFLAIRKRR